MDFVFVLGFIFAFIVLMQLCFNPLQYFLLVLKKILVWLLRLVRALWYHFLRPFNIFVTPESLLTSFFYNRILYSRLILQDSVFCFSSDLQLDVSPRNSFHLVGNVIQKSLSGHRGCLLLLSGLLLLYLFSTQSQELQCCGFLKGRMHNSFILIFVFSIRIQGYMVFTLNLAFIYAPIPT